MLFEDRNSVNHEPALVKFVPSSELIAARDEKRKIAAERERNKERARLERERVEAEKLEKGKLSHLEMFKSDEYEEWDEHGIPTKEKGGNEVSKSKSKTLKKAWERQKKAHEAYLQSTGDKA